MKALVIIPAFNEENNIVATINNLKKVKIKKKSIVELRILKLEEELRKAKEAANK